jgi:hypothetical protein
LEDVELKNPVPVGVSYTNVDPITVPQIQNEHLGIVWCREKRFSLGFKVQSPK